MKITESKLKEVIRSVIREAVYKNVWDVPEKFYPKDLNNPTEEEIMSIEDWAKKEGPNQLGAPFVWVNLKIDPNGYRFKGKLRYVYYEYETDGD